MVFHSTTRPPPLRDFTIAYYEQFNKDAFVISTGVLGAVTILANLFLMIVILLSSKLRSSSQHIIIFALCLADLFAGAFEYPLLTQYLHLERWIHSCKIFDIFIYDVTYIMPSLKSLLIISMGANSLFRIPSHAKKVQMFIVFLMIGTSVAVSVAVILPLRFLGKDNSIDWNPCYTVLSEPVLLALNILSIVPQALGLLVIIGLVLYFNVKRFENDQTPRSRPWDIIVASVIVILCHLPQHLVACVWKICLGSMCKDIIITHGILDRIQRLSPCVLPFVWFLNRLTREGFKQVCSCARSHKRGVCCVIHPYHQDVTCDSECLEISTHPPHPGQ